MKISSIVLLTSLLGSVSVLSAQEFQETPGSASATTIPGAYRGIGIDYNDGGFLFNTKTYGPNLGLVFRF